MPVRSLLHHSWRYWRGRARKALASTRVDDRDGVPRPQGWRLENFHMMTIVWLETSDGIVVVIRGRRKGKGCCDWLRWLDLMLERRGLRWATRHGTFGRCRVNWVELWARLLFSKMIEVNWIQWIRTVALRRRQSTNQDKILNHHPDQMIYQLQSEHERRWQWLGL